jgi:hypothetical protein
MEHAVGPATVRLGCQLEDCSIAGRAAKRNIRVKIPARVEDWSAMDNRYGTERMQHLFRPRTFRIRSQFEHDTEAGRTASVGRAVEPTRCIGDQTGEGVGTVIETAKRMKHCVGPIPVRLRR